MLSLLLRSVTRRAAAVGDSSDSADAHSDSAGSDCSGSGSNNSSSSNSSSTPRWTDAYPCKFYPADDDGCTRPRTCFDCLNVPVNDQECMVNEYARCVPKNDYTFHAADDYRLHLPANVEFPHGDQKLQFPADEATYCDAWSDPMCAACQDTVFADVMTGTANESLTRYCYGEHGCVCVALCEAPWWNSTIGAQVCHGAAPSTDLNATKAGADADGDHGHRSPVQLVFEIIAAVTAVAAIVVVAQVIKRRRRRREEQEEAANGSNGSEENSAGENAGGAENAARRQRADGPQLSLFGWQAMRSELIEREQLLLAGVEDFSNVRTGYIQLLDVQASAPEEDETVARGGAGGASAPVMLVPLAGASAPPLTPTMPSAPDFDDMSDDLEDDDHDMAEL